MARMRAAALAKKKFVESQQQPAPYSGHRISEKQAKIVERRKAIGMENMEKRAAEVVARFAPPLPAATFYNKPATGSTPSPQSPAAAFIHSFAATRNPGRAPHSGSLTQALDSGRAAPPRSSAAAARFQGREAGLGARGPVGAKVQAVCSLVSRTRFEVTASFHSQLIDIFKAVPSSQYRPTDRVWSFALSHHDLLLQRAASLAPEVTVTALPSFILATFRHQSPVEPSSVDLSPVSPSLLEQLMPFQREGLQYGVSRGGRLLIADDMGLGKTVQALGLASYYSSSWPILIVAPSSMRFAWEAAVRRWLEVEAQDISVITNGKDFIGSSQVVILSYDLLTKKRDELLKKNYQLVILDESHMIKDGKSARTRAAEPLAKSARQLILLSCTPALSRPIELYTQVSALLPRLFRNASQFGMRYCDGKMKKIGRFEVPDFSGSSHMAELSLLLQERCMIRRLKQEVTSVLCAPCFMLPAPPGADPAALEAAVHGGAGSVRSRERQQGDEGEEGGGGEEGAELD